MALARRVAIRAVANARAASTAGSGSNFAALSDHDPEMDRLLGLEKERQLSSLELIASENYTSRSCMELLGSCLTNKYSEGLPGARYYGGNQVIDQIENLCIDRTLDVYNLSKDEWGVNVQPLSGSPANMAAYTALLKPHDRIMGLNLPDGGHLTHGYYTKLKNGTVKPISATSVYFESLPYSVDPVTGIIDYDGLAKLADIYKPRLIICGASAYPRDLDYKRFREIADSCGAYLMCDMAHISGLVAGGHYDSPFEYCDVVTSTTHKTLRGPRSGLAFGRKHLMDQLNAAVFPMLQGGPHIHQIAAVAAQMKEVKSPEFQEYIQQVVKNAAALADALVSRGGKLATGGTTNHLMLWDLRPFGINGNKMEALCDTVSISLNKNTIHGDANALAPGAVRLGTPALTTRGLVESDFEQVADFLWRTMEAGVAIQEKTGKKLVNFKAGLIEHSDLTADLKSDIAEFARSFPMPERD